MGLWALVILIVGGFIQSLLIMNPDLTWLYTLDGKWLAGGRLYTDLFEVNPPISPILYLAPLELARITGAPLPGVTTALVLAFDCGSVWLTWRILRDALETAEFALRFALALLFIFVVFAADVFGQRDYIAVVALTPFVALAGARLQGGRPAAWLAVLAGAGAGLAMAIKPEYALPAGAPLLWAAFVRRSFKPLFPIEFWVASAVVVGYSAVIWLAFPAYTGAYLQNLLLAYVPAPRQFPAPLWIASTIVALTLGGLACLRLAEDDRARRFAAPWLAASLGGLALFVSIGKWWSYGGYGALAFAAAPLLFPLTAAAEARPKLLRWGGRLTALAVSLLCMQWLFVGPQVDALAGPVASVAPPHPRLISISGNIAVGHPLVWRLKGEWVGTSAAQVMAASAIRLEQLGGLTAARRARLDAVIQADRHRLADDIARGRPDIILSDTRLLDVSYFDWWAWANKDPRLAALLAHYHRVGVFRHQIEIWKRDGLSPGGDHVAFDPDDTESAGP